MLKAFFWFQVALLATLLTGCATSYPWVVIEQAEPNPFVGKSRFYITPIDYTDLRIGSKTEDEYVGDKDDESAASFDEDKEAVGERFHQNLVRSARQRGLKVKTKKKKSAATGARLFSELTLGEKPAQLLRHQAFLGDVAVEPEPKSEPATDAKKPEPAPRKLSAEEEFDEGVDDADVAEGPFVIKPHITFMEPGYYAWITKSSSVITMAVQITDSRGKLLDEIEITYAWGASMVDAASGTRYRKISDQLGRIVAQYLDHRTNPPPD
jgi:hypothetical protein